MREVRERKEKVRDVMGPVTPTADRLGLSVRQRTLFSAAVANSMGVDIDTTNINRGSAWKRAQQERLTISKKIKEDFRIPDHVVVHWDGKILKIKGNILSNRVCVYITGVTEEECRKLLGVPETSSGTGAAEADVVKSLLGDWAVKGELCGMVFDTTSSNSGSENGACKLLEDWLGTPILWLACRHHVLELHLKRVVQGVRSLVLLSSRDSSLGGTPWRLTTTISPSWTTALSPSGCRTRVRRCWTGH